MDMVTPNKVLCMYVCMYTHQRARACALSHMRVCLIHMRIERGVIYVLFYIVNAQQSPRCLQRNICTEPPRSPGSTGTHVREWFCYFVLCVAAFSAIFSSCVLPGLLRERASQFTRILVYGLNSYMQMMFVCLCVSDCVCTCVRVCVFAYLCIYITYTYLYVYITYTYVQNMRALHKVICMYTLHIHTCKTCVHYIYLFVCIHYIYIRAKHACITYTYLYVYITYTYVKNMR
jgi:hypothetical protein